MRHRQATLLAALTLLAHVSSLSISRLTSSSSATHTLSRRNCLAAAAAAVVAPQRANAFVGGDEETSGLVVLRIAEVCDFQEKLLRTIAKCSGPGAADLKDQFGLPYCGGESYSVSPVQILFGTGVMLKNSNLDGNMKLMIQQEVPKAQREAAVNDAVGIMNCFNGLIETARGYDKPFEPSDMILVADIYADARNRLAKFFNYLTPEAQKRFYNYADTVRKYEEEESKEGGIERMKL